MTLTLNQFLFLILTFSAVVVAIFLVLFLIQMRRTAAEGEKTLIELKKLIKDFDELNGVIKDKLEALGQTMEASRKTLVNLSEASFFLTARFLKPASRYWPFIYPLIQYFLKKRRKKKEEKNG